MKTNEQKGSFVYKGRKILLNGMKGAIPEPGSAEQGRARLNWICMYRKDREGRGLEGGGQSQLRLTDQPET